LTLQSKRNVACLLALLLALAGAGCARRERPEESLARSRGVFLRQQIAEIEKTIGQVERGEITTTDQVAIGLSEDLTKRMMNASLPFDVVVGERLHIRIDSATPSFSGKAAVLLRATVTSVDVERASAALDIAATLADFQFESGRLRTRLKIAHFAVRESGLGELAADVIERLVRANSAAIEKALPGLEIPVQLDESISIGGLTEGPVVARPGVLPLSVGLSQVLVGNHRLWVLLKAETGTWQPAGEPVAAGTPTAGSGTANKSKAAGAAADGKAR
jgi:hypothetical protein